MIREPVRFLIVDDIEANLVALEALLRRDGLEVLKARSGPEALNLLLSHDVALAFLDVQMPSMDGFELAALMRGAKRTRDVPIVFVTAGTRDQTRVIRGYESGAVDFLFKPIDPRVLKAKADVFFDLHRQRRELSNALRLNETFVAVLGHDLRNPLSAMLMGAYVLRQALSDPEHLRTLQRITSAGGRMTAMIEQLLDLTRARLADGLGFLGARARLDVGALVQRVVDELQGDHLERQITVDSSGDCMASGDEDRLLQLFSNPIGNAVQHGEPGSAVSVAVEGADRGVFVRVRNRGAIPEGILPTIFDPFRGKHRAGSGSRGLGLGLFISEQIAIAHGGTVSVESTEDAGTTFTVRLPRRPVSRRPAGPGQTARTVLVVDGDESVRDSLREAFTEEGYQVATASNGREALDGLIRDSSRPDVVILDVLLPVAEGAIILQAMRADASLAKIPVIVPTSHPSQTPAGVVVIPRPLTLAGLLDTVADLCATGPSK